MLRWNWARITMTVEEQQQFANQRLCTSPLHNILGKPNQPRGGDHLLPTAPPSLKEKVIEESK